MCTDLRFNFVEGHNIAAVVYDGVSESAYTGAPAGVSGGRVGASVLANPMTYDKLWECTRDGKETIVGAEQTNCRATCFTRGLAGQRYQTTL